MRLEYRHLQWMEFVWDADLTTKAKAVAAYLARCMNKDHHVAWPSLESLAGKTGLSRRSVIYALDELDGRGWITKDVGGPGLGSNRYYAVFPKQIEAAMASATDALSGAIDALGGATDALDVVQQLHPNQSNRISPKKERGRFAPPSPKEALDCAVQRGYSWTLEEARHFVDHHASRGWKVRGTAITNWQAAVGTWERRRKEYAVKAPAAAKEAIL